jgi:uncharacterized protein (TIGR04552 family)
VPDREEVDGPVGLREMRLHLADIEAIRLLIGGQSVVDWARLPFESHEDVDRFLGLLGVDVTDSVDQRRLRYVFNEAVAYAEENLPHLNVRHHVGKPEDIRDLFLWAAEPGRFRRRQMLACVTLKLMHVIHHMQAADLKFRSAVPEAEILDRAEASILRQARYLREGTDVVRSFYGSRKSRSSTIAKLVAKRENVAATIFDKLRFRVVVETPDDIVPTLAWMTRHMLPFSTCIPGQSHNNLVDPDTLLGYLTPRESRRAQGVPTPAKDETLKNEFSGTTYRSVNFIVDYPVRIDELVHDTDRLRYGRAVFVMVEFQVLDAATALANEEGENAHHLYKQRQWRVVEERLLRGAWLRQRRTPEGADDEDVADEPTDAEGTVP